MKIRVRLPGYLRENARGLAVVDVEGNDLKEVLENLCLEFPSLRQEVMNPNGEPVHYLVLFVNDTEIKVPSLAYQLQPGDELSLVVALAGG